MTKVLTKCVRHPHRLTIVVVCLPHVLAFPFSLPCRSPHATSAALILQLLYLTLSGSHVFLHVFDFWPCASSLCFTRFRSPCSVSPLFQDHFNREADSREPGRVRAPKPAGKSDSALCLVKASPWPCMPLLHGSLRSGPTPAEATKLPFARLLCSGFSPSAEMLWAGALSLRIWCAICPLLTLPPARWPPARNACSHACREVELACLRGTSGTGADAESADTSCPRSRAERPSRGRRRGLFRMTPSGG